MKNKKTIVTTLAVLGVLFITAGVSYAFFSYSRNGTTENTITSGSITFHYEEGNRQISVTDAMPMTDATGKIQNNYFDFTVTSTTSSNIAIPYYITARRKGNDNSLDGAVKFYLEEVTNKGEQNESVSALELETGSQVSKFSELSTYTNASLNITSAKNEKLLYEGTVPAGSNSFTKDYRLRMWLSDTAGDVTYNQTITGSCSDPTYTTREACTTAHEDWTDVATSQNRTFTTTINVYAEGETSITPAASPTVINCPNCVFAVPEANDTNYGSYAWGYNANDLNTIVTNSSYSEDYNDVIDENTGIFLGLKLNSLGNAVEDVYACGIYDYGEETETVVCIKGEQNSANAETNYLANQAIIEALPAPYITVTYEDLTGFPSNAYLYHGDKDEIAFFISPNGATCVMKNIESTSKPTTICVSWDDIYYQFDGMEFYIERAPKASDFVISF